MDKLALVENGLEIVEFIQKNKEQIQKTYGRSTIQEPSIRDRTKAWENFIHDNSHRSNRSERGMGTSARDDERGIGDYDPHPYERDTDLRLRVHEIKTDHESADDLQLDTVANDINQHDERGQDSNKKILNRTTRVRSDNGSGDENWTRCSEDDQEIFTYSKLDHQISSKNKKKRKMRRNLSGIVLVKDYNDEERVYHIPEPTATVIPWETDPRESEEVYKEISQNGLIVENGDIRGIYTVHSQINNVGCITENIDDSQETSADAFFCEESNSDKRGDTEDRKAGLTPDVTKNPLSNKDPTADILQCTEKILEAEEDTARSVYTDDEEWVTEDEEEITTTVTTAIETPSSNGKSSSTQTPDNTLNTDATKEEDTDKKEKHDTTKKETNEATQKNRETSVGKNGISDNPPDTPADKTTHPEPTKIRPRAEPTLNPEEETLTHVKTREMVKAETREDKKHNGDQQTDEHTRQDISKEPKKIDNKLEICSTNKPTTNQKKIACSFGPTTTDKINIDTINRPTAAPRNKNTGQNNLNIKEIGKEEKTKSTPSSTGKKSSIIEGNDGSTQETKILLSGARPKEAKWTTSDKNQKKGGKESYNWSDQKTHPPKNPTKPDDGKPKPPFDGNSENSRNKTPAAKDQSGALSEKGRNLPQEKNDLVILPQLPPKRTYSYDGDSEGSSTILGTVSNNGGQPEFGTKLGRDTKGGTEGKLPSCGTDTGLSSRNSAILDAHESGWKPSKKNAHVEIAQSSAQNASTIECDKNQKSDESTEEKPRVVQRLTDYLLRNLPSTILEPIYNDISLVSTVDDEDFDNELMKIGLINHHLLEIILNQQKIITTIAERQNKMVSKIENLERILAKTNLSLSTVEGHISSMMIMIPGKAKPDRQVPKNPELRPMLGRKCEEQYELLSFESMKAQGKAHGKDDASTTSHNTSEEQQDMPNRISEDLTINTDIAPVKVHAREDLFLEVLPENKTNASNFVPDDHIRSPTVLRNIITSNIRDPDVRMDLYVLIKDDMDVEDLKEIWNTVNEIINDQD